MDKTIQIELEGIVQRDKIRIKVKEHISLYRHDLQRKLTNKVVQKCLIFISGYIKCLKYHGIQPINLQEMEQLLMSECIDWVIQYLDDGGK
jgi:hypothetical protein